jgi:uncharacterized protein (DUF488 family)
LYRELATLERDGYVERGEASISLNPATSALVRKELGRLTRTQGEAVESIIDQYARRKASALLRDVYRRYPWYASKSELSDFVPKGAPKPFHSEAAVYTVGYEGKAVDDFFNGLLAAGITGIIDVRANPVSRKYGFAKRSMSQIALSLGLGYDHLPELGIPSDHRAELTDFESYQRLLDHYENKMLPHRTVHIRHAASLLRLQPSALLCVESDVRCCHRGRLANRVAEESGLPVTHL